MTKAQAVAEFERDVLPRVVDLFGPNDRPARREAWNDYADNLQKSGQITRRQAETWTQPRCVR